MPRFFRHKNQPIRAVSGFVVVMAIVLSLLASMNSAKAAERVALIIGNSSYKKATELKNPRNDAEEMAKLLTKFGFRVLKGIDVDQFNFRILVRAFTRELKDSKLALFYFAGHGLQVGQRNFLLPVDAELKEEAKHDRNHVNYEVAQAKELERKWKTSEREQEFIRKQTEDIVAQSQRVTMELCEQGRDLVNRLFAEEASCRYKDELNASYTRRAEAQYRLESEMLEDSQKAELLCVEPLQDLWSNSS